ncbi:DUF1127 domain-containing protein [Litoreibacter arenae]|uniref:YjiS-like domain-containing protein n=1 Tax=Litoreibacter arenae DSM 19593 TaxID=1123360 RepID=S9QNN4_9RHOB|nr:DUF1127 domain-containing protein [Litoreibacter arenae]EPX81223.1 hypothetical protein thalar_00673 [Litoreibacter arenae DSM 19593]
MAYTTSIRTAPTLIERLVAFKNDLAERHAKYRVYRTTLNELQTLSDRELADLGLSPSNVKSVAYEAAYKN